MSAIGIYIQRQENIINATFFIIQIKRLYLKLGSTAVCLPQFYSFSLQNIPNSCWCNWYFELIFFLCEYRGTNTSPNGVCCDAEGKEDREEEDWEVPDCSDLFT